MSEDRHTWFYKKILEKFKFVLERDFFSGNPGQHDGREINAHP